MRRIGLFGGSFDPVHTGHLLVARTALEGLALDRLFFLPAAQSPFKPGQSLTSGALRARLLRLALAGWTQCEVDTGELERGGVSYTIDTVRAFTRRFPGAALFWLIGGDHLPLLPQWREAHALAELVEFAVVPRPGVAVGPGPGAPFRIRVLAGSLSTIAASDIRARVRAGQSLAGLVPAPVAEVIRNSGLYL
ncbi:MAG: nicotinate (nicotinamide) nucleotide adenylyltransferase [Verrucomicrobiales bacterium]|nr:nicotinate (nicotinamide) nucleotide adenylyltransferase [Verrucomicrobiales bacterium]